MVEINGTFHASFIFFILNTSMKTQGRRMFYKSIQSLIFIIMPYIMLYKHKKEKSVTALVPIRFLDIMLK